MSLLMDVESADFNYLLEATGATRGNISVQLKKLNEAKYLTISKTFGKSYPLTTCKVTNMGREAFEKYVEALSKYINPRR